MSKYLEKITLADFAFFCLLSIYFIFPENAIISVIGHVFTAIFSLIVLLSNSKNFSFPVLCLVHMVFVFMCFISIFYSIKPADSQTKTVTVAVLSLLFLATVNYFSDKQNTVKFEIIFLLVSILSCLYLLSQGNVFSGQAIGRAIANKNQVGVRLAMSALVSIYSIFRKIKWWKFAVLITLLTFTFLTGSRSALIVFAFGAVLLLILGFSSQGKPVGVATIVVVLIALFILYLVFNVPILYNILGARLEDFFDLLLTGSGDSSSNKRVELISKGLEVVSENPLFGQGISTFITVSEATLGYHLYSHDNYIELLEGVGVFGTVVYYIIPVSLIICSIILARQSKETRLLGSFMFSMMIAYFVSDIFSVNYYQKSFVIIFAFIYGSYIAYHKETKPEVRVAR